MTDYLNLDEEPKRKGRPPKPPVYEPKDNFEELQHMDEDAFIVDETDEIDEDLI